MIKVEFKLSEDKKNLILTLNGHAGQADIGKDIVCSASTILAYTVAQCVTDMHKANKLRKKPTIHMKSGEATIVAKPLKATFDECLHAYMVVQTGYTLLAKNYPQYVKLTEFDVTDFLVE